jgi:hypothetical protein
MTGSGWRPPSRRGEHVHHEVRRRRGHGHVQPALPDRHAVLRGAESWRRSRHTSRPCGRPATCRGAERHRPSALTPRHAAQSNATLAVVAALVKALVEDGVLTAEQLQTVLDAAQGADGSTWAVEAQTDDVVPLPFIDYFGPEAFDGTNGVAVDESNSDFAWGPVVDPVATGTVSAVFDTSQKYAGTSSLKTVTNDGAALALRAALFQAVPEFYIRFYFNAAAPPATGNCRIYAAQFEPGRRHHDQRGTVEFRGRRRLVGASRDVRQRDHPGAGVDAPEHLRRDVVAGRGETVVRWGRASCGCTAART